MFKSITTTLVGLMTVSPATPEPSPAKAEMNTRGSWGLQTVEAENAWPLTLKENEVIVAVIDTGADIFHPDLQDAIWTNAGESGPVESEKCRQVANRELKACDKSSNGFDDDGNGFIDDLHGWNFAQNNLRIEDHYGHGTHVAGIIAATGAYAIKGVAPNAKLMILKYADPKWPSGDPLINTVRAIDYAVKMGAKIINYSAGGKKPSRIEREAIARANEQGVLFIAAAGNEGNDSDIRGYYPADYGLSNIVSVTAIDPDTEVLPSSNFGSKSVQVAAPGEKILSTMPKGRYGLMTGTSQATAFVSGVAAMMLGNRVGRSDPRDLAMALAMSGKLQSSLKNKTKFETVLNAKRALVMHDHTTSAMGLAVEPGEWMDPRLLSPRL